MKQNQREEHKAGYHNLIAERYLETKDESTLIFAKELEKHLNGRAKILDVGCGSGIPIAKYLSGKFDVCGIDFSAKQIELAKNLMPKAKFKKLDMLDIGKEFVSDYFDGIISMYSIIHVKREKHLGILKDFYKILKSSGYLMICMGLEEFESEEEYLGGKMFWSHYDKKKNLELLKNAGFEIVWKKEWNPEKDPNDRHLFVLCKKSRVVNMKLEEIEKLKVGDQIKMNFFAQGFGDSITDKIFTITEVSILEHLELTDCMAEGTYKNAKRLTIEHNTTKNKLYLLLLENEGGKFINLRDLENVWDDNFPEKEIILVKS